MPESPAYAHREALLSTISLHHHWAQLEHSACGAGRGGTTGTVSGAGSGAVSGAGSGAGSGAVSGGGRGAGGAAGALKIVYILVRGVAPRGTGERGTRGTP